MSDKNGQYAVETVSLTKIFPDWWGRAKVIAVDDLNLQIKHNEVYGLLGPNGSGKTTTLKMLLSLLHPSKGMAFLLGGSSRDTNISSRVGYLPEESYLYKYLSAKETLEFYGKIFGLPRSVRKSRIESLLEMVGLAGMANRPVGTFSKGMARRIGLAQALINDPDLLILDEPTSGMDPIGTRQMKDLIMKLAQRGKTILLCSHLLADVEDVCDRIGIMYGGKMHVEGEVNSLLQHRDEVQIKTGQLSENAMSRIREIVQQDQGECEIEKPMDKLEEFFVRTVAEAQKAKQPTSGAVNSESATGFLTEEEKTEEEKESVLDGLVGSKKPDQPKQQSEAETTSAGSETEQVSREKDKSDKPAQKDAILKDLTGGKSEQAETEKVSKSKPEEVKPESTEDIKDDLLRGLMDRGDGATDKPKKDEQGGSSDA
ncbi:putative ABC transporter ATP-binding protein YxlF [Anaerohalosphaera lusitana]|uniref:Putative ABC transporter ATP-binding protein YxlF n=1 Tax=Anaerohalosphaera lusitana TaxID=1936003 RepID=A0A1U9NMX2_9BACT|nr:ABC transporter ATP-binding protein [Anaerohalosphaera lusitana]AQT68856.1 putative ABC transporter ATP-binding protein YxlF [Anaerohalosphaera lusitana]